MNIPLLLRTIRHLKPTQVFYQVKNRLVKPAYIALEAPPIEIHNGLEEPIARYTSWDGRQFSFLNLEHEYAGWNFTDNGMLWAYNQNYMDWLNQSVNSEEIRDKSEGEFWIDKFIEDLPSNRIGLGPYPIALRSINWVKFFCRYPDCATKQRLDSLYSQLRLLEKKLEYHLLGNHLLEDAYALYIGAAFFNDERLLKKAERLLLSQLEEQILPDGAHYEQSPMYHCILLDRLLDCINIRKTDALVKYAIQMLGHLESIVWKDGTIPMLNDSANGIAPLPSQLFDYARRLGLSWMPIQLKECGYRRMVSDNMEAIVDVRNITATYQPGHTHADTFNYELRINGMPFVVDTGISTYNKTERRQLERSTIAHNTVSVNGGNSSEVWGGFRVGRRATVSDVRWKMEEGRCDIEASHNGFGKECWRKFSMNDGAFAVEDRYDGKATSYIHLADGADENRIIVDGAESIEVKPWKYSTEYNRFHDGKVLEIHFKEHVRYTIQ
ncbi:MAG: alginate lyase family protein [Bacteroidales bacterium]|nr:alginate lyase family protein [Bacteroidales bacterium]